MVSNVVLLPCLSLIKFLTLVGHDSSVTFGTCRPYVINQSLGQNRAYTYLEQFRSQAKKKVTMIIVRMLLHETLCASFTVNYRQ